MRLTGIEVNELFSFAVEATGHHGCDLGRYHRFLLLRSTRSYAATATQGCRRRRVLFLPRCQRNFAHRTALPGGPLRPSGSPAVVAEAGTPADRSLEPPKRPG